jgi:hypothetical protein
MPKDDFDFEDPLELNAVALLSEQDTTELMTECFVEEFMRLGYNHKQILALFRNPHYLGMNMALQHRGEPFVRTRISEAFARWGKPVRWPSNTEADAPEDRAQGSPVQKQPPAPPAEAGFAANDPMGAPIPNLDL